MGTFHQNLGSLHGMTIVVDTTGDRVVVGRCHEATDERIIMVGADVHVDGENDLSKDEYLKKVARNGFWEKHPSLVVPREQVASVRLLGEISAGV